MAAEVHSCNVRTTVLQFKWPEHSAFVSIKEHICWFKWRNIILFHVLLPSFFNLSHAYGKMSLKFFVPLTVLHPIEPEGVQLNDQFKGKLLQIFVDTKMTYFSFNFCVLDFTCRHVLLIFFPFLLFLLLCCSQK